MAAVDPMLSQLLAIGLGGALGAVSRFLAANGIYGWLGRGFPHGTLFVNVSGSFLMGMLTELLLNRFPVGVELRAAVLVGFLGAYTTFSTFALESFMLLEQGSYLKALLNMVFSSLFCIMAVWIGMVWGRTLFAGFPEPWGRQGDAYAILLLGWVAVFVITLFMSLSFHALDWPAHWQKIPLVILLGVVTLAATLWMTSQLSDVSLELGGLFSVFALNGLCAAAIIWTAFFLGRWLWHLYPSH